MNIWYIRAAIEEATGIRLTLEETVRYLVEEGKVSRAKAKNLIFPGYSSFYKPIDKEKQEITVLPVDRIITDD